MSHYELQFSAVRRRRRRRWHTDLISATCERIFMKFSQIVCLAKSTVRAENWTCSLKPLRFMSKIRGKICV